MLPRTRIPHGPIVISQGGQTQQKPVVINDTFTSQRSGHNSSDQGNTSLSHISNILSTLQAVQAAGYSLVEGKSSQAVDEQSSNSSSVKTISIGHETVQKSNSPVVPSCGQKAYKIVESNGQITVFPSDIPESASLQSNTVACEVQAPLCESENVNTRSSVLPTAQSPPHCGSAPKLVHTFSIKFNNFVTQM